jgi:hypothetical protein
MQKLLELLAVPYVLARNYDTEKVVLQKNKQQLDKKLSRSDPGIEHEP